MAIGFGTISAVSTASSLTSVAVSGSDTLGIVAVANGTGGANAITAVSWGGSAMTQVGGLSVRPTGDRWISVWYIVNPSSSATISFTGGTFWRSYNWYYTGVDQASPLDASNSNTNTNSATIAVTVTVVASNCWTIAFAKDNVGGTAHTTDVGTIRVTSDGGGITVSDSDGTVGTGGQTTTIGNGGATDENAIIGFSIKPAGASTTIKTYNGATTATVKTVLNGTAIANRKTWNGIT